MELKIAKVLLPYSFDNTFNYIIPEEIEVKVGSLVNVSFRNTNTIGVVWGFCEKENNTLNADDQEKKYKLKEISSLAHNSSLQKEMMDFVEWVANYNLIPMGLVLKMVIAPLFKINKVREKVKYQLAKDFSEEDLKKFKLTKSQLKVIDCLNYH